MAGQRSKGSLLISITLATLTHQYILWDGPHSFLKTLSKTVGLFLEVILSSLDTPSTPHPPPKKREKKCWHNNTSEQCDKWPGPAWDCFEYSMFRTYGFVRCSLHDNFPPLCDYNKQNDTYQSNLHVWHTQSSFLSFSDQGLEAYFKKQLKTN